MCCNEWHTVITFQFPYAVVLPCYKRIKQIPLNYLGRGSLPFFLHVAGAGYRALAVHYSSASEPLTWPAHPCIDTPSLQAATQRTLVKIYDQATMTIIPSFRYKDPAAAIKFLCEAFGFVEDIVFKAPDGHIMHAELILGNSVI